MRIGIVSPAFPPAIGGAETYAFQFERALLCKAPGYEVTVFTRPHPGGEVEIEGVRVIPRCALDMRGIGGWRASTRWTPGML